MSQAQPYYMLQHYVVCGRRFFIRFVYALPIFVPIFDDPFPSRQSASLDPAHPYLPAPCAQAVSLTVTTPNTGAPTKPPAMAAVATAVVAAAMALWW